MPAHIVATARSWRRRLPRQLHLGSYTYLDDLVYDLDRTLLVLAPFSPTRYRSRVAKDAFILSDLREPTLTIVCQPCGRRGRYSVERLIATHGDAKILYLLAELTNCPKAASANIYDRCKARYEGLSTR
jgi:hypothetical protein